MGQTGSTVSIWSKSAEAFMPACVVGLRPSHSGMRVVVTYELPDRGLVEKDLTIQKLRTLMDDEHTGAADRLWAEQEWGPDMWEEAAYKADLQARRDREVSVQTSTERAQLEADGQRRRRGMTNQVQQAQQYEEQQWQLEQIGKQVWISSRAAGGAVQARVAYRFHKFWALYDVDGISREKELTPRLLWRLTEEQAVGGGVERMGSESRFGRDLDLDSPLSVASAPTDRSASYSPARTEDRAPWRPSLSTSLRSPDDGMAWLSPTSVGELRNDLSEFLDQNGLAEYEIYLRRSHGCKVLEDITSADPIDLSIMADDVQMHPADRRRFLQAVGREAVNRSPATPETADDALEDTSHSINPQTAASAFLAQHRLDCYTGKLSRSHGFRVVGDFLWAGDSELSELADGAQMLPADKRRFLAAVAEERTKEFFDQFDLERSKHWNLDRLMSASQQELHEFLSGKTPSEQRQIHQALDQRRPCPAAAIIQQLQEQRLSESELQRRAAVYVEQGHANVGTMMSVQGDRHGLIQLIAEGEKLMQQRQRESERQRVIGKAEQDKKAREQAAKEEAEKTQIAEQQAKEIAEAKKQAEEAKKEAQEHRDALEKAMQQALAAQTNVPTGTAVERDRDGVYRVQFLSSMPEVRGKVRCSKDSSIDWHQHLHHLGITSIQIYLQEGDSETSSFVEGALRNAVKLGANAAGVAAGGVAATTGVGMAASPAAARAASGAANAVGDAVVDALYGSSGGAKVYLLKVEVHKPSKFNVRISAEGLEGNGSVSVVCKDVSRAHTCELVAATWPKLASISRDKDFDTQAQIEALDAKRARPDSVSDWLDVIGLGDEADMKLPPEKQLRYAQQLAEQHYCNLGDLYEASEEDVTSLLECITVPALLDKVKAAVPQSVLARSSKEPEPEPEPEPEVSLELRQSEPTSSPMPELHKRKFMGHWRASQLKFQKEVDQALEYEVPVELIAEAKNTGDPRAVQKLLAKATKEIDIKQRFLESLVKIEPKKEPTSKTIMWEFTFRYKAYKRPDKTDLEVTIRKRYSEVEVFHKELDDQIKLDQQEQKRRGMPLMKSLGFYPPAKDALNLVTLDGWMPQRVKWDNQHFLSQRKAAFQTYFEQLIRWEQSTGYDIAYLQCFPCAQQFFAPYDSGGDTSSDADDRSSGGGVGDALAAGALKLVDEHAGKAVKALADGGGAK